MPYRVEPRQLPDGRQAAVIINRYGEQIAETPEDEGYDTLDELLAAAHRFYKDNPELFTDPNLVDTPEQSVKRNPGEFGDGKLAAVPEARSA